MYPDILTSNQTEILPTISLFSRSFYLVGGTAIALQIGHRQSIDFDLFTNKTLNHNRIGKTLGKFPYNFKFIFADGDQLHGLMNQVKITFYEYPYQIPRSIRFQNVISMPSLLDLGAMKAYALGRRSKWKDYVDLYFILKTHYTFSEIAKRAEEIFGSHFNEKLFAVQLTYFDNIDFSEPVVFLKDDPSETEIKGFLTQVATKPF